MPKSAKQRAARRQKFEKIYESCVGSSCAPKRKGKRPLNAYQKFVRDESKKSKYKDMKPTSRMKAIGKAWRNSK